MQQGQISIDLLVTLIVVVMLIGAFTLILSGFQSGQEEFFLRTQLKENSANLASFITSTNSLSDINFTTKIMIHPINYKNVSKRPFVTIDNNYLLLTVDTDIGLIEEKSFFSKPINSEITREGELLVISNE